jgi:hypothetical protein
MSGEGPPAGDGEGGRGGFGRGRGRGGRLFLISLSSDEVKLRRCHMLTEGAFQSNRYMTISIQFNRRPWTRTWWSGWT